MENNLTLSLENYRHRETIQSNIANVSAANPASNVTNEKEEHDVVIFHDSLCKNIKDTIMINENVKTTKTWAPTLNEIQDKVENMDNVDTIVIESLTRHLRDMNTNEIVELASKTVETCLQKGNKVVISSIIQRDDDKEVGDKAENVNVNLMYKYLNNPRVMVCNNDNLRERKFCIADGVHLTDYGTSRFANNLKFKIAESLGITIDLSLKKKDRARGFFEDPRQNRR